MLQHRAVFFLITLCAFTVSSAALSDQLMCENRHKDGDHILETINDFFVKIQCAEVIKAHFGTQHKPVSLTLAFLHGKDPNPIKSSDLASIGRSDHFDLVCFLISENLKNSVVANGTPEDIDFALIHIFTPDRTANQSCDTLSTYVDSYSRPLRLVLRWAEKKIPDSAWAASPRENHVIHFRKRNGMNAASYDAPDSLMRWAIQQNFPTLVEILVQAGANPGAFFDQYPYNTPLHEAAKHGFLEVAQTLIKHLKLSSNSLGNLSEPDINGNTPLHLAARRADLYLVRQKELDAQLQKNQHRAMTEVSDALEQMLECFRNLLAYDIQRLGVLRVMLMDCLKELPCAWPRNKILATNREQFPDPEQQWPIYTQNPSTGKWSLVYVHKGHGDVALELIAAGANTDFQNNQREKPAVTELQKLSEHSKEQIAKK